MKQKNPKVMREARHFSDVRFTKNKLKELGLLDCNSTMENRIYHLYYENTIENDIIKRFQRKLAESNAINGQFNVTIEDDDKIRTASQFSSKLSIK